MVDRGVLLELRSVVEVLRRRPASCEQVDLDVADGEFITILGPSGSGQDHDPAHDRRLHRSRPRARSCSTAATSPAMPINRRPFNTVFQDYALFPHLTVAANVGYGLMVRGTPRAEVAQPRRAKRSTWCSSARSASAIRRSSPAASASAWRLPAPSSASRA